MICLINHVETKAPCNKGCVKNEICPIHYSHKNKKTGTLHDYY